MRRIETLDSCSLPPLRLYRDDFDHVLEVLGSARIRSGDYEYDSLGELHEKGRVDLGHFSLAASDGVELRFDGIAPPRLSAGWRQDDQARFLRLKQFLESRRRWMPARSWPSSLVELFILWVLSGAFVYSRGLEVGARLSALDVGTLVFVLFVIFPVLVVGGSTLLRSSYNSVVELRLRNQVTTFLSRKKDDLLWWLLMLVLGAAGKAVWDWIAR